MAARLQKQDDIHRYNSLPGRIEAFLNRHAFFFLFLFIVLLFVLVIVLLYTLIGVNATGTEANTYYYHLEDII